LRYTPAGVPVSEGRLQHSSSQIEGGAERVVEVEIAVLALGESARWLQAAPLGGASKRPDFSLPKAATAKCPYCM
jgi:primosomal replication protein N